MSAIDLPALPDEKPLHEAPGLVFVYGYTAEQMRAYARDAVLMERALFQEVLDMLVEVLDKIPLTDSGRFETPTAAKARAVLRKFSEQPKTRNQRLKEAGFTRRPTWHSLPSDDQPGERTHDIGGSDG